MAANTSILIANPDFFSIKDSLKYSLKNQAQFRDYNFDGSNLNALLDVLATNTYQGAFSKNMVAGEMFMSTAQVPSSIYSKAKELCYVPRSARSASALLTIEIVPDDSPSTITIPKETIFTASAGARSLTFTTPRAYLLQRNEEGRYISDIVVYEGLYLTDTYNVGNNTNFVVSNQNVDMDSIEVIVQTDAGPVVYNKKTNIIDIKSATDSVFYTELNYRGFYEVYFGDNIIGAKPGIGSVVTLRYRVCSAEQGNRAGLFRNSGSISGYSNVTISRQTISTGGAGIENPEITRKYAPLANQIRDRAFTTDDYEILLRQAFPEITALNVFGGEELNPPQYGKVAISVTTEDSLMGISNNLRDKYTTFIKSKNPTMINPIFIDPDIISVRVHSKVFYDYTLTTLTENDITARVKQTISTFNTVNLNNFNTTLYKSKLTGAIDASEVSIQGNETKLEMVSIVDHVLLRNRSRTIELHNSIALCSSFLQPSVYSTTFKYDNKVCRLVDDYNGVIYIETNLNGAPSKIKAIGAVNYTDGSITLQPTNIQELYTTNLKIFARPLNDDISASLNTIIQVDFSELKIESKTSKKQ